MCYARRSTMRRLVRNWNPATHHAVEEDARPCRIVWVVMERKINYHLHAVIDRVVLVTFATVQGINAIDFLVCKIVSFDFV